MASYFDSLVRSLDATGFLPEFADLLRNTQNTRNTRKARRRGFSFRVLSCVSWAMSSVELITSLQNPRVKQLVKLRDRRPRDEAGVFLVEGYRQIRRALDKGIPFTELYICPEWYPGDQGNEAALIADAETAGAKVFQLTKDAFAKVAYRERPDGLLAVAPQWRKTLADLDALLDAEPDLVIVAYGMNDVGRRDPQWYREQTGAIVRRVQDRRPGADVLLVATMLGNDEWIHTPREMFDRYRDELAGLVGEGVALVDMTAVWESLLRSTTPATA